MFTHSGISLGCNLEVVSIAEHFTNTVAQRRALSTWMGTVMGSTAENQRPSPWTWGATTAGEGAHGSEEGGLDENGREGRQGRG